MSHTADAPTVRLAGSCGIASGFCCSRPRPCPHPTASPHPLAARLGAAARLLRRDRHLVGGRRPHGVAVAGHPAAGAVLVSVHLINVGIEYTANHLSRPHPHTNPCTKSAVPFTLGMLPFGVAIVASAAAGLVGGHCRGGSPGSASSSD